jgi:hypothetical protein
MYTEEFPCPLVESGPKSFLTSFQVDLINQPCYGVDSDELHSLVPSYLIKNTHELSF